MTSWRFLRYPSLIIALTVALLPLRRAIPDTPASQVTTQTIAQGQSYPEVATRSTGWFDVGGYCKVVDVGPLSFANPPASGVPVFIPGPADQWENYRTKVPSAYQGQVTLTTCCRPQSNVATLCAGYTNPSPISRAYGRLGETDQISGICIDAQGNQFTDVVSLTCAGDNGPDGQAAWGETSNIATQQQPSCPSQTISWEDYSQDGAVCSGALPVTQIGFGVAAVQIASAANGWYGGSSGDWGCISNGSGGAVWKGSPKMSDGYRGGVCAYQCTPSTTLVAVGTCNAEGLQEYRDATCGDASYQPCGVPLCASGTVVEQCLPNLYICTPDPTREYEDCGNSCYQLYADNPTPNGGCSPLPGSFCPLGKAQTWLPTAACACPNGTKAITCPSEPTNGSCGTGCLPNEFGGCSLYQSICN